MNKDFYDELPGMVCEVLEDYINKYGKEKWFEQAWEEYRQYVLNASMNDVKMPGYIFKKYIEVKDN